MTPELTALALAGLLQVVQFALMSVPANLELGPGKTLGPRDPDRLGKPLIEQVSPRTGRLFRALNNHFEGLILFTLAVVVVTLSGQSSGLTAACAWTYLVARILYVPAYAFGLVPWRSLIWMVGFGATTLMLLAALF
ncbi:MAG: MAPEG family protein [Rhodobacterales bacterium]|nr:MAPEG family protein [Rhodobacterales bacterium]MDX5391227.1 MAPEG family protein [Rhodobacterales bacterium]MDX5490920.1 MAPEG family protein [Rhodobacterales bacterium]